MKGQCIIVVLTCFGACMGRFYPTNAPNPEEISREDNAPTPAAAPDVGFGPANYSGGPFVYQEGPTDVGFNPTNFSGDSIEWMLGQEGNQDNCIWNYEITSRDFLLKCQNGEYCDMMADGFNCCYKDEGMGFGYRGGRKLCPKNFPVMCASKTCACAGMDCGAEDYDYCCEANDYYCETLYPKTPERILIMGTGYVAGARKCLSKNDPMNKVTRMS